MKAFTSLIIMFLNYNIAINICDPKPNFQPLMDYNSDHEKFKPNKLNNYFDVNLIILVFADS